jgi:hypothetical protein
MLLQLAIITTKMITFIAYKWELKNHWSLSPEFIADGGAKTYVAGLSLGYQF